MKKIQNEITKCFKKSLYKKYGEDKGSEILDLYNKTITDYFINVCMSKIKKSCIKEKKKRIAENVECPVCFTPTLNIEDSLLPDTLFSELDCIDPTMPPADLEEEEEEEEEEHEIHI